MIPLKTSVGDIKSLGAYLSRQIGWIELSRVKKALGSTATDDRKIGAMAALGLIERDGGNVRLTPRGSSLAAGDVEMALSEALLSFDLYRVTAEWLYYQKRTEITVTEIGQYWEGSHRDTLGEVRGPTLKDGAVCFGRIAEGAGLTRFTVGRGGKETRLNPDLDAIEAAIHGRGPESDATAESGDFTPDAGEQSDPDEPRAHSAPPPSAPLQPRVTVAASPSVHVNVEIHIAADATADTVREIFKNMAKYVLDKAVDDAD